MPSMGPRSICAVLKPLAPWLAKLHCAKSIHLANEITGTELFEDVSMAAGGETVLIVDSRSPPSVDTGTTWYDIFL
jgi:hypothetical protein